MHRLFRLAAVFTALFMVMAGLKVQPAAAAQDGLTGDTSYESPKFGIQVEWSKDWEALPDFTTSGDAIDSLRIYSEDAGSWIDFWFVAPNDPDPATFIENYVALLEDSDAYANLESTEQDSADPDAVAMIATYEFGDNGTPLEEYIEVRPVGDALVLTSIKASQGLSMIAAILAMSQVDLDGDPIFPSLGTSEDDSSSSSDDEEDNSSSNDDEDTSSNDDEDTSSSNNDDEEDSQSSSSQSGVDGGTYVAPTFGVYFEFDENLWEVADDVAADDSENERDLVLLRNEDIPAVIYFESYDSVTRASDCLESASEEAYGDADAEIFENEDGEAIEDSSRGVAYAAYLFETDGDENVAYVECRALPEGAGVFVITMLTLPDSWEDAYGALGDILDTVDLEGGSSSRDNSDDNSSSSNNDDEDTSSSNNDDEDTSSSDDNNDDSGSAAAGTYESPTYGFVVEYDEDVWTQTDDSSRRGTDTVELENEDDVILTITSTEAGSRDDAESCVADQIDTYDVELVPVTTGDDKDPAEGETDFGYYTILAYDDEDGEQHGLYIECGASPDGDFLVLFVADGPWDGISDMIPAVTDVVEAVEF
jgi:hypothetical protein